MQDKLDALEKRVTALEISRAETNSELRSINGKLDQLIRTTENIVENFVSTPTCLARLSGMKEDMNGLGSKLRGAVEEFNTHIKDHWTKADRMATWLSTALIGAFIIGKIAKIW